MKVRATQDGHYGGYYRYGPRENENGAMIPGEVFEIDAAPFEMKDEHGKPIVEMDEDGKPIPVVVNGKQKMEEGKPVFRIRMATRFSPAWMVRVPDDVDVTNEEQVGQFGILKEYRVKKPKVGETVPVPADVAAIAGAGQKSPL